MKNIMHHLFLCLFILGSQYVALGQEVFRHTAERNNTLANVTTINHPLCNGIADAFLIVSQNLNSTKYNPHHIAVVYSAGKWHIVNQELKPIPIKAQFNVLIMDNAALDKSKASLTVHSASAANISGHMTTLNNPFINNDPNIQLIITPRLPSPGRYNNHSTGVWYAGGKWKIYNEDSKPMPQNMKFNILMLKSSISEAVLGTKIETKATQHKVTANNRSGSNYSFTSTSYNNILSYIFPTHYYGKESGYHYAPIGVSSQNGKWNIFNQDRSAIRTNTIFNLLSVTKKSTSILNIPQDPGPIILSDVAISSYFLQIAAAQSSNTQIMQPKGPNFEDPPMPVFSNLQADSSTRFNDNESSLFSRISSELIPDKEAGSGVFYYYPNAYHLEWDKDANKHSLQINYSRNTEGQENKSARVSATLTSGITIKERTFMEDLYKEILKNQGVSKPRVQLRPLPVESPQIQFTGGGFGINNDQISIVPSSDFSDKVQMSFTTSDDNIDALKSGELKNKISFILNFNAKEIDQIYSINADISIMDEETYGIFELPEFPLLENITNPTPYPIKLQYLHVLSTMDDTSEGIIPYIYSFDLGNKIAQPNDVLKFTKPANFSGHKVRGKPLRAFVEYSLQECEPCTQNIINELTGGVTAATKQEVAFQAVNLLKSTGAEFIMVFLKSKQLDPGKQKEITTYDPIEIEEDGNEVESPTLYLLNGEQPNFEYKVSMMMPDGDIYEMNNWVKENKLKVYLTKQKLIEHFNQWPQTEGDEEE